MLDPCPHFRLPRKNGKRFLGFSFGSTIPSLISIHGGKTHQKAINYPLDMEVQNLKKKFPSIHADVGPMFAFPSAKNKGKSFLQFVFFMQS
jgi:hypothetical protein